MRDKGNFMTHPVVLPSANLKYCTVPHSFLLSLFPPNCFSYHYIILLYLNLTSLTAHLFLSLSISPSLSLSLMHSLIHSFFLSLSISPSASLHRLLRYYLQVTHSELIHGFTACVVVRLKDSIHLQTSSGELWSPLLIIEPSG